MKITRILLPAIAIGIAASLVLPTETHGFSTIGGDLDLGQRDFRVFNNFTDASANNNTTQDACLPGYDGAELAIWKGGVEWSSGHGTGCGDPHQSTSLGSGGANFDLSWQGNATGTGGTNSNVHSELSGCGGSTLAFTETPISSGWRIRYFECWDWADGPGTGISGVDLQGVACHEIGHSLGLGHTSSSGATMRGGISGNGVSARSINGDDQAGVQFIYGVKANDKPEITGIQNLSGNLTIFGSDFSSTGNEVWFTQAASGGNGTPIKLFNVLSTGGGTQIDVIIPGSAGPGDLFVKRQGSGHDDLSNAWPVDPSTSVCPPPVNFCNPAVPNSTGQPAHIMMNGTQSVAANNMSLTSAPVPVDTSIFIYSDGFSDPGVPVGPGPGNLCISTTVIGFFVRGPGLLADPFGFTTWNVDLANPIVPEAQILPGSTWYFQHWYRDNVAAPGSVNWSDGIEILFCP